MCLMWENQRVKCKEDKITVLSIFSYKMPLHTEVMTSLHLVRSFFLAQASFIISFMWVFTFFEKFISMNFSLAF